MKRVIIPAAIVLLACVAIGFAQETAEESPGELLFYDAFDDPTESLFEVSNGTNTQFAISNGTYHIRLKNPWYVGWELVGEAYNCSIAVDIGCYGTIGASSGGVVFRGVDDDNYLSFEIRNSGQFRIGGKMLGQWHSTPWWYSAEIRTGAVWNHVEVVVDGAWFAAYVNGKLIHFQPLADLWNAPGEVGLTANAGDTSDAGTTFDDFEVHALQAASTSPSPLRVRLRDQASFDFFSYEFDFLSGGEFYLSLPEWNEQDQPPYFWANNIPQRGIVDMGVLSGEPDLCTVPLRYSTSRYEIMGVPAAVGHTYAAMSSERNRGHHVIFRVMDIKSDGYVDLEFCTRWALRKHVRIQSSHPGVYRCIAYEDRGPGIGVYH